MPDYPAIFSLGLVYGLTICSMSCMPYLAPYLIGSGEGFRKGITDSMCFVGGKLIIYSVLGGFAALVGHSLDLSWLSPWGMGIVLILVGVSMLLRKKRGCCEKNCSRPRGNRISLLALGVGSSLVPCPPLAAVFVLAAQQGDILRGVIYGLVYGLGLVLSPLVIIGGGLSLISSTVRTRIGGQMRYVEGLASLMMVVMGVRMII